MTNHTFFDEQSDQSEVKAAIIEKYFWAWAKVILSQVKKEPNGRIAYIDLFAGPGRYKDGSISTPLKVLARAIDDPDMRTRLVSLFNDVNGDHSQSLTEAVGKLPGIETLKFKPQIRNEEVGEQIVKEFEKMSLVPTLFFVDPWGYKGLSLRLVNSVLKDWGCDCIFFFNYNRISMGLNNPIVKQHMDALFGPERAEVLRVKVEGLKPKDRENAIVEELANALKEMGGRYVLPFRFRDAKGTRTSHHLIFVSKHVRGYEIMKGIMARESSTITQGVGSFEYSPADAKYPMLFEMARPLDDLGGLLLKEFAGQKLTMREIYEQHHVGRPFIDKNYKDALKILEAANRIATSPSASERKRNTFADHVEVTFPRRFEAPEAA